MAVTPMQLQVLFMQENRVAQETEKQKRFQKTQRDRMARRNKYNAMRTSVEDVNETEFDEVDEEGGQRPGQFQPGARRNPFANASDDEGNRPEEQGKGTVVDFRI